MSGDVSLGGRHFAALSLNHRTVRWQLHVDRLVGESGIDRILPTQDEDPQTYMARLHAAVMRSGKATEILGCFLLPMGKGEADWTPAMAAETAAWIEGLDTEADIQEVYRLGLEFVLGFFGQRLRSLASSLSSFGATSRNAMTSQGAAH